MNALERYIRTLTAIHEGADTITGVAERLGMLRPTVETHFRWLREHRYIQGTRPGANLPAFYVATSAGRKWLIAHQEASAHHREKARRIGVTAAELEEEFAMWWEVFPRKVNRKRCLELWIALPSKNRATACAKLSTDCANWAEERRELQYIPTPETWLRRIAAATVPVSDKPTLPKPEWPTPDQIAERKRDLAAWKRRLHR